MKNIKKYIRSNSTLAEGIILLVGIILALCGTYLWSNAIVSAIGASIIASAIVVFMTDVFIGDNTHESVNKWGLEAIYTTRGEMNSSCDIYLKRAKYISIIAFGLRSLRDTQQRQIERILKRGGSIRIITMDPRCNNLREREIDERQSEDSISYSIEQLIDWGRTLNSRKYKGRIEIRFHNRQPLDFLFLMDNRLFTGPYEYGKNSQQTISFEYSHTGSAYEYYKNYFNELWNDKEFCKNAFKE